MSKVQHTPGPCIVVHRGELWHVMSPFGEVSSCSNEHTATIRAGELNAFWRKMGEPDLLAAVRRFVQNGVCTCHDGGPGFQCDYCQGIEAIRKVEG